MNLSGIDALRYVRSRHFQQEINGHWREDKSSDFGRISRQQDFIRKAASKAFQKVSENPLAVPQLLKAALKAVHPDSSLDLQAMANRLSLLGRADIVTYTLPAKPDRVGDADVLRMDPARALPLLAFFGGKPPPAAPATTAPSTTVSGGKAPAPGGAAGTTASTAPPTSAPLGVVPDETAKCG